MRGGWWETGDQTWLEIAGKIRRNEDLKKCKLFHSRSKVSEGKKHGAFTWNSSNKSWGLGFISGMIGWNFRSPHPVVLTFSYPVFNLLHGFERTPHKGLMFMSVDDYRENRAAKSIVLLGEICISVGQARTRRTHPAAAAERATRTQISGGAAVWRAGKKQEIRESFAQYLFRKKQLLAPHRIWLLVSLSLSTYLQYTWVLMSVSLPQINQHVARLQLWIYILSYKWDHTLGKIPTQSEYTLSWSVV